jgi:hypothetical protein
METWWHRDVLGAGKLPLMLCFLAFVVTFAVTRTITRLIRAGRGPFRDRQTANGVHIHHAVPGLILLVVGAFVGVATSQAPGLLWSCVSAVSIGIGVSLVLDEFALILHLTDVYWSTEGRLSVDLISLAAAGLGLALVGFSPLGVNDVGGAELVVRLTSTGVLLIHGVAILTCVLKGKYSLALFGLFIPFIALVGAVRVARPASAWARHRYDPKREEAARRREANFDRRWDPVLRRWQNLIGGAPSLPDPET